MNPPSVPSLVRDDCWIPETAIPDRARVPGAAGLPTVGRPIPPTDQSASAVEKGAARQLWLAARPSWAQAGWWDADLSDEVRALMWLPVGVVLQQALLALSTPGRARRVPLSPDSSARHDSLHALGECHRPHLRPTPEEATGVAGAPCGCQVVVVAAWASIASWAAWQSDQAMLQSVGAHAIEVPASPRRPDLGTLTDCAIEDVAPALRSGPASAEGRVSQARDLFDLPELWRAVASGLLLDWHARLLMSDLRNMDEDVRRHIIIDLLCDLRLRRSRGLAEWTFTELRRQARRLAARQDPDFSEQRRSCHRRRGVRVRYPGGGAGTVTADLTDDVAARIFHRLSAIANGLDDPTDNRSLEQKRADVFVDLILGQAHQGAILTAIGTPTDPGRRTPPEGPAQPSSDAHSHGLAPAPATSGEVAVVINLSTLQGLDSCPGYVPGVGPIPPEVARELAADRAWRAWITETRSTRDTVVATSPRTYRPPAGLARLLRAREPHCRMPGCRSMVTDLDHIVPFPRGATTAENLQPLCRRHHRMKTHTRWRVQSDEEDSWIWTSPNGVTFRDVAESPLP